MSRLRRILAAAMAVAAVAGGVSATANADPSTSNTLNQNPNIVQSASPWTTFQGGAIWQPDYDTPDGQLAASRTSGTYMTVNNETAPATVAAAQPVVSEAGITGPVGAQYIVKVREKTPSGTLVRDVAGPTETIDSSETGQRLVIQGPAAFTPAVGNKLDIRLSIYATLGQTDVDWIRLSTPNGAPVAGFTYSPASPVAPASIDFTSTSTDPNGDAIGCDWDFNADGLYDDGTGCNVAGQLFEFPGSYAVGLRATDIFGATDTEVKTITVAAANPQAEPPAPTGLTATPGNGTCALDWADTTADPAVIRYQVYVNQVWPGPESTTSNYTVAGLTNGTTYDMRVGAFNGYTAGGGDGYGPWGPVPGVSCTPQAPPPPPAACADGLDNDLDGKIDYPLDPGCTSATDTDETDAPPVGDIFTNPFPNSALRRLATGIGFDANSASQVSTFIGAARTGNSGRGPNVFNTGEARFKSTASDPLGTIQGTSIGGSTSIHVPAAATCSPGIDPTMGIYDTALNKVARLYGGSGGSCTRAGNTITGQNLGVDTNGDGIPNQGIGTAWGRMSGEGIMHGEDVPTVDHRIKVALANNLSAKSFRAPALSYEGQSTGSAYPSGIPAGATFCHVLTPAQIDSAQASAGLTGVELSISDAFWAGTACNGGYGLVLGDGTAGFTIYMNVAEFGASATNASFAVRMPSGHNSGGQANATVWANANWRELVAG